MADEQIASIRVFQDVAGILVEIDAEITVISFCLSERQRNTLVFELMNPRRRPTDGAREEG